VGIAAILHLELPVPTVLGIDMYWACRAVTFYCGFKSQFSAEFRVLLDFKGLMFFWRADNKFAALNFFLHQLFWLPKLCFIWIFMVKVS
jgi:hypothetical protein